MRHISTKKKTAIVAVKQKKVGARIGLGGLPTGILNEQRTRKIVNESVVRVIVYATGRGRGR